MKKTLVAIAVLASAGAASAQYTLSGGYTFGYKATDVAGAKSAGFGNDGASIKLTAVEDLGNGLTATASISAGGLVRSTNTATGNVKADKSPVVDANGNQTYSHSGAVDGENANLALAGGFGKVTLATNEGSVTLSGWQGPASAFDGKVLSANSVRDSISYELPKFGDFTVTLGYTEDSDAGLGYGIDGADKSFSIAAAYASGPLSARASYAAYKESDNDGAYSIRASYNAGVVTVGGGFAQLNHKSKGERRDFVVGGNIPMGALTLGLNYASRSAFGSDASKTGTSLGVSYALSKTMGVNFATTGWKAKGGSSDTETTVTVSKSF